MDPLFDLRGKVAVITGGASGIGAMIARGFVERGVRTLIVGRTKARCKKKSAELSALGECEAVIADVATDSGRTAIKSAVDAAGGKLHILVNNAGFVKATPIETLTEEEWDQHHDINTKAVFFLTQKLQSALQAAAPASIINIGSVAGLVTREREVHPYLSSKAGVHHLTRGLAKRLGKDGIRVNAIAPGFFQSDIFNFTEGPIYESAVALVPVGRIGQPNDIVGLTTFLASQASAFVNGAVITLDGGMTV